MPDQKISREDAEEIWYCILHGVQNGAIRVEDPPDAVIKLVKAYWNLQSVTGANHQAHAFRDPRKLLERPSVILKDGSKSP